MSASKGAKSMISKEAGAGEKVIVAVGFARPVHCPHVGWYLKSFDFDAEDGRGFGAFTQDITKAMRFESARAALDFWRTKSTVKPVREDGRPNRPLTALTIDIQDAP